MSNEKILARIDTSLGSKDNNHYIHQLYSNDKKII